MASPLEEIKERLDIVDVVKSYIELKPAGKNFKGICPFHAEKTPSLIVSPERQIWHCFGCNAGGDAVKFVSLCENIEFYEALRILAEKAHVDLKRYTPAEERQFGVLYEIQRAAADFFKDNLAASSRAMKYLEGRKLSMDTIEEFEIGFAPESFDALTVSLIERKFELSDIVRSGLSFRTDSGKYIDRFRGRIMFPIHNHFGKIVGFTGRILPELERPEVGKYVNSPETPIFAKSKLLYGFWKSKKEIRESGYATLLEGQMDFLMCWQDGVRNAIATSGTALTGEHLRALRKTTDKLVIGFDNDEAGKLAVEKAIDLAAANDFTASVASWGECKDAAELVEKKPGAAAEAVRNAEPAMDFVFNRYLGKPGVTSKLAIRAVLDKINRIWSPIDRSFWIRELSHRAGIGERELVEEMEKIKLGENEKVIFAPDAVSASASAEPKPENRLELISLRLLGLAGEKENLRNGIGTFTAYLPEKYRAAYLALSEKGASLSPEIRSLLNLISLRGGLEADLLGDEERLEAEFRALLQELEIEFLANEKNDLAKIIASLEEGEDDDELVAALKKFDEISKKIQNTKNAKENAGQKALRQA
ncbi:MAG: DNA primase [Patescibacteria group bacterium]|nr:DNA primase [Patescibacteria group bacterium]